MDYASAADAAEAYRSMCCMHADSASEGAEEVLGTLKQVGMGVWVEKSWGLVRWRPGGKISGGCMMSIWATQNADRDRNVRTLAHIIRRTGSAPDVVVLFVLVRRYPRWPSTARLPVVDPSSPDKVVDRLPALARILDLY